MPRLALLSRMANPGKILAIITVKTQKKAVHEARPKSREEVENGPKTRRIA